MNTLNPGESHLLPDSGAKTAGSVPNWTWAGSVWIVKDIARNCKGSLAAWQQYRENLDRENLSGAVTPVYKRILQHEIGSEVKELRDTIPEIHGAISGMSDTPNEENSK